MSMPTKIMLDGGYFAAPEACVTCDGKFEPRSVFQSRRQRVALFSPNGEVIHSGGYSCSYESTVEAADRVAVLLGRGSIPLTLEQATAAAKKCPKAAAVVWRLHDYQVPVPVRADVLLRYRNMGQTALKSLREHFPEFLAKDELRDLPTLARNGLFSLGLDTRERVVAAIKDGTLKPFVTDFYGRVVHATVCRWAGVQPLTPIGPGVVTTQYGTFIRVHGAIRGAHATLKNVLAGKTVQPAEMRKAIEELHYALRTLPNPKALPGTIGEPKETDT